MPSSFTRVLVHAILDAIKVEKTVIAEVQSQIRAERRWGFYRDVDTNTLNFLCAIIEGPTALPAKALDSAASAKP